MKNKRNYLAIQAVKEASRLRLKYKISPTAGLCPFDLGRSLGISMRLLPIKNLEGMYSAHPNPAIIIGSERPHARMRYTCGHELGHHIFNHGFKVDSLNEDNSNYSDKDEEYIAQRFSSALLMPKVAVNATFFKREWKISNLEPEQFFIVAQELGVGYQTLITNLEINTNQISSSEAKLMLKERLPDIRNSIANFPVTSDVFHLSNQCARPKLDIEVGDIIILSKEAKIIGDCIQKMTLPKIHHKGIVPGIAKISFSSTNSYEVRVCRKKFRGLAHYRYLEEVDNE